MLVVENPDWNKIDAGTIDTNSFLRIKFKNLAGNDDRVIFKPIGTNLTYIGKTDILEDESGHH